MTHGSDGPIQHYRLSILTPDEAGAALRYHAAIAKEVRSAMRGGFKQRGKKEVLTLTEEGKMEWQSDRRWERVEEVAAVVGVSLE